MAKKVRAVVRIQLQAGKATPAPPVGPALGQHAINIMFCVFGLIGALTGYQAKHYLTDLGRRPVITEGEILRKWHKGNLLIFLFPSFYVFVEDKIFSIPRQDYALLLDTDLVRISHYPGSLTVDFVERYDTLDKRYVPTTHGVSL